MNSDSTPILVYIDIFIKSNSARKVNYKLLFTICHKNVTYRRPTPA